MSSVRPAVIPGRPLCPECGKVPVPLRRRYCEDCRDERRRAANRAQQRQIRAARAAVQEVARQAAPPPPTPPVTLTPAEIDRGKIALYNLRRALTRTERMRKDPGYTDSQTLQLLFRDAVTAYRTLDALSWGDTAP